jgi:IclR family acetate operon transcriptional repressor
MQPPVKKPRGRPKSVFTHTTAPIMQALDRALSVLEVLARMERASLTDVSQAVDIPAPTVHRILTTLLGRGYAAFDEPTQHWMVGIEAYRTGTSFIKRTNLMEVSRPVMRALMRDTGETANLAVADGSEVVFIGQIETPNPIRAFFNPGTRTAMHASGTGKALLAAMDQTRAMGLLAKSGLPGFTERTRTTPTAVLDDLAQTRARGWSFDREERHSGMSCIGAAIFDARGEAVAGVSISGPSNRFPDDAIDALGARVRQAAAEITAAIGGVPGDVPGPGLRA